MQPWKTCSNLSVGWRLRFRFCSIDHKALICMPPLCLCGLWFHFKIKDQSEAFRLISYISSAAIKFTQTSLQYAIKEAKHELLPNPSDWSRKRAEDLFFKFLFTFQINMRLSVVFTHSRGKRAYTNLDRTIGQRRCSMEVASIKWWYSDLLQKTEHAFETSQSQLSLIFHLMYVLGYTISRRMMQGRDLPNQMCVSQLDDMVLFA